DCSQRCAARNHTRRFIAGLSNRTHFSPCGLGCDFLHSGFALVSLDLVRNYLYPKPQPTHVLPDASELVLRARLRSGIWCMGSGLRRISCSAHPHCSSSPVLQGLALQGWSCPSHAEVAP